MAAPAPIDASPIQNILFVARLGPHRTGYSFEATSLPGHLIHLVLTGRVQQECNGRRYELRPGRVIWYHEDELVKGTVLEGPWTFYSVNFIAPTLPPPAFESRLYTGRMRLKHFFARILHAWESAELSPLERKFQAHASLLQILADLGTPAQQPVQFDPRSRLWWEVETELRRDLRRPIHLEMMAKLAGTSEDNLARACRLAVGMSPMRRVKQIRLSLARGLVMRSELTMSEIADHVGYSRVHEFSRDYRKHFGKPPTADRS